MTRNMNVYGKFTDTFKYLIKGTYVLQKLLFLMVLMTLGNASVWGQVGIDYSGTYYIASDAVVSGSRCYNADTPTNNYYLCPTESWISFNTSGATNDTWTTGDDKPFLTTYKINNHK